MRLIGMARLGKDAEVRYTAGSEAVANLSLAFNYGKKDAEGVRPTQWVRAALWGERAEKLSEYLTKGRQVFVILRDVHMRSYEKDGGGSGVSLEGTVETLEFGAPAKESSSNTAPAPTHRKVADDGFEDDIPF